MTQQKLYTEEEIRRTFGSGFTEARFRRFMNELTPIEIPTDEEIWHESNQEKNLSKDYAFARGAEWMRDKILNK